MFITNGIWQMMNIHVKWLRISEMAKKVIMWKCTFLPKLLDILLCCSHQNSWMGVHPPAFVFPHPHIAQRENQRSRTSPTDGPRSQIWMRIITNRNWLVCSGLGIMGPSSSNEAPHCGFPTPLKKYPHWKPGPEWVWLPQPANRWARNEATKTNGSKKTDERVRCYLIGWFACANQKCCTRM